MIIQSKYLSPLSMVNGEFENCPTHEIAGTYYWNKSILRVKILINQWDDKL